MNSGWLIFEYKILSLRNTCSSILLNVSIKVIKSKLCSLEFCKIRYRIFCSSSISFPDVIRNTKPKALMSSLSFFLDVAWFQLVLTQPYFLWMQKFSDFQIVGTVFWIILVLTNCIRISYFCFRYWFQGWDRKNE